MRSQKLFLLVKIEKNGGVLKIKVKLHATSFALFRILSNFRLIY